MEEFHYSGEIHNCKINLREKPRRRKDKVRVGCGAGFGGDRPNAAVRLLERVEGLDYIVLECLAERTLADRYQIMMEGGVGYDHRISEWMSLLLPLTMEKGVCIITNMGAVDPHGAQTEVLKIAENLGFAITVALAFEIHPSESESESESGIPLQSYLTKDERIGSSTYLGAAPIVECLEKYNPHVVITSRVADAALFLGPMIYELGWDWNEFQLLSQGSLAGHLLECGCQLTGGYFMHPGDKNRIFSFQQLLDLSLPFSEVSFEGDVCVAKANETGGMLNYATCAEQLLYEVGDPGGYITPDVVIDFRDVIFCSLSQDEVLCLGAKPSTVLFPDKLLQLAPKDCGWKGWGEISYGGYECVKRAEAARFLVLSWMEEAYPGIGEHIVSYIIGLDSLKTSEVENDAQCLRNIMDVRLRMDGKFKIKEHAVSFVNEFTALYTNGPAGGGGISTGHKKEMMLEKTLVVRESVFWKTEAKQIKFRKNIIDAFDDNLSSISPMKIHSQTDKFGKKNEVLENFSKAYDQNHSSPIPSNKFISLYEVAHSRAGDKGNDLNFSIIPHFHEDFSRLKKVITSEWVMQVISKLLNTSSFPKLSEIQQRNAWMWENVAVEIYEVKGIQSLNVVVRNILDGGVNFSRRIDRHGKTISDLILNQKVVLPL
ncbi:NAD-dependent aldehyde dehydrogenase [Zostera marina]|uniref:NAD-dependent aldehyde dehydrogenase n=1 Tax=Zostera marina TaxID=29655 RepID=A0A0K9P1H4_ZOSMR|nr:NAD-dependent aldehyde dehydrogenase [Zostera marina]